MALWWSAANKTCSSINDRHRRLAFQHTEGAQYGIGRQTNSRVLDATFDPPSRSIYINLEGVQHTAGRSEFSIPKGFMTGPSAVSLDGRPAESVSITENQMHTTIKVEHGHDLKENTIQGTTAVPEFPLPAALAAGTWRQHWRGSG